MKEYKVSLETIEPGATHRCEGCIFFASHPALSELDMDNCLEPDELDCELRGQWYLEELE